MKKCAFFGWISLVLLAFGLTRPSFAREELYPVSIGKASSSQVDQLAQDIITKVRRDYPNGGGVVDVVFYEGQRQNPAVTRLISKLIHARVQVRAPVITRDAFEKKVNEVEETLQAPEKTRRTLKEFMRGLFGTENGFAVVSYFGSRDESGKWSWRRPDVGSANLKLAVRTTLVADGFFSGSIYGSGHAPALARVVAANAILGAWVFGFIRFQREVLDVKLQGNRVIIDTSESTLDGLRSSRNPRLLNWSSFAQESLLGAIIVGVLAYPHINLSDGAMLLLGAGLSAYSYVPVEYYRSKYLVQAAEEDQIAARLESEGRDIEAEHARGRAEKLDAKARHIADGFWNVVFPAMKNTFTAAGLLVKKAAERANTGNGIQKQMYLGTPFIAWGTAGKLINLWQNRSQLQASLYQLKLAIQQVFSSVRSELCENYLVIRD